MSIILFILIDALQPEALDQKAGISSLWNDKTGTPNVSKNSIVFGISSMAFGPAAITVTFVFENSLRSAETSNVSSASK